MSVTHLQELDYSIHTTKRITYYLKVVETADIPGNQSDLKIYLLRKNSGKAWDLDKHKHTVTVNGEKIAESPTANLVSIPAYGESEMLLASYTVKHNSSGTATFTVKLELKAEYQNTGGLFKTFWTIGETTISKSCITIDQSIPSISNLSVSANRYGEEASASFTAMHESYPLTKIQFTLSGLTRKQAQACTAANAGADSLTSSSANDVYSIVLTKEKNLLNPSDITFAINATLDSGGHYGYSVTVNAQNGKSKTETGILAVPQKVTGIWCEEKIDLKQGTSEYLDYSVLPSNSELLDVTFQSSDSSVADIDEKGLITAKGDGMCNITVTTVDGNFSASCIVSVYNTDIFPQLSELRILTAKDISKLSTACNYLRGKMIESGTDVPVFVSVACEGRSHPVAQIRMLLEAIESNCQTLKASAAAAGILTDSLPEPQTISKQNINWYTVINEWILFLNELNEKLN